jgi:hypothetical protein
VFLRLALGNLLQKISMFAPKHTWHAATSSAIRPTPLPATSDRVWTVWSWPRGGVLWPDRVRVRVRVRSGPETVSCGPETKKHVSKTTFHGLTRPARRSLWQQHNGLLKSR